MPIDLIGKPILITGASSGIGAATAVACARAGMPVLLAARRQDKLAAVAARCNLYPAGAAIQTCDVTRPEDCTRAVEKCIDRFGTIYAVFANAGYGYTEQTLDLLTPHKPNQPDKLRDIFETNFFGTINTLRAAAPYIRAQGQGHFLICSSSIGKFAVPNYAAYCASKAAQWPIGFALNAEHHNTPIHATTVHPIGTKTEFFEKAMGADRGGRGGDRGGDPPSFTMQSADHVARRIVRALRKPTPEVWPSTPAKLAAGLFTALPTLAHTILRRAAKPLPNTPNPPLNEPEA